MNEKILNVTLDLYRQNGDLYSLNQGNSTTLNITLLENGELYSVKDDLYPALIGIRRDGRKVPQITDISVSENIVTIALRQEFLRVAGVLKMELWLIDISEFKNHGGIDISSGEQPEGYAISTFPFSAIVHGSLLEQDIPEADDAYPLIAVYTEGSGSIAPATRENKGTVKIGKNISVDENGLISVPVADKVEINNTKPVSSDAVYAEIGNIEILLTAL